MKKILFLIFCMILLVGTVSAADFDDVKYYNEEITTYTLENFFGFGKHIADLELKTPQIFEVPQGYQRVAEIEIGNGEYDYNEIINGIELYDIKDDMKEFVRDIDYKYKVTEDVEVDDYEMVCQPDVKNGTICNYEIVGSHIEQRGVWEDFTKNSLLKGENTTIGIFTEVQRGDHVEWILNVYGNERLTAWAEWQAGESHTRSTTLDPVITLTDQPTSFRFGINITVGYENTFLTKVTTMTGVTANTAYLYSVSNTTLVDSQSITDNNATFDYMMFGSETYLILVGNPDVVWTLKREDSLTFPIDMTEVSFVSGIQGTGFPYTTDNVRAWNIKSLDLAPAFKGPTIILNSPVDNFNTTDHSITFNGTVWDNINLINVSLIVDDIYNETNSSGINNVNYLFTKILADGTYNWTYEACDNESQCTSVTARTFTIDSIDPLLNLTAPSGLIDYGRINNSMNLNWSVSDVNLDSCWYNYNGTNVSVTCGDNHTTFILEKDNYNLTLYSNDTAGNEASNSTTWTYKILENYRTYNNESYETVSETFLVNVSSDGSQAITANIVYNGTTYSTTKSGNNQEMTFSRTMDLTSTGNKSFYWSFSYGAQTIDSSISYQNVSAIQLGLCNATLTVPYINFSFLDEETLLSLNATMDSSTWEYWLGDGTHTKELLYSNTSENTNYAFCLIPGDRTLYNTRSIQYASSGYPQRKYDASSDLTNSTTNKTLYLLSSADGIYSTIQVVDEVGDRVSGVEVTIERQFIGVWTIVGQETTDDAGTVTFWVNPDYDHRFTFVSDECIGVTVTVRPTQTQYTQQLQCGVGAEIYVSQLEGLKYARTPRSGIIGVGTYNFSFQLLSSKDNIINASFEIINTSNQAVLNSTWSTCSPGGCTLYLMHVVGPGDNIKGRYYVDVGNGSILLEGDAHWIQVLDESDFEGKGGMRTFWRDMIYVFQEWGDDSNTADFNKLVFIFFIMCVSISFLNYHFNVDTANPGAFLVLMTIIIWMGSIVGGTDGQGFFYYNNLFTSSAQGYILLNNYLLALICTFMTFTYYLGVNRRAQG